ncbi:MAG: energy transducer TonB [Prevotellaceae bacterium]|jgi:protein TonB|nr:energy transducer TonB [Prevotellaceae bacterium]
METKKTPKTNLENKRMLFREIGLIVALLLVFMSFEWKTHDKTISVIAPVNPDIVDVFIPPTMPEPPQPSVAPPMIIDNFLLVDDGVDVPSVIVPTEPIPGEGYTTYTYRAATYTDEPIIDDDIPVVAVDEKPKFMSGDENEFTKWVLKNMTYPDVAIDNRIQGRVICSFVVNTQGNVVDVKILRGVDPTLDREAVRVISMSPKWVPGKHYGKPARVKYTFPVIFQLK